MLTAQPPNSDLEQLQKTQPGIAGVTEKWKAVVERDDTKDPLESTANHHVPLDTRT